MSAIGDVHLVVCALVAEVTVHSISSFSSSSSFSSPFTALCSVLA